MFPLKFFLVSASHKSLLPVNGKEEGSLKEEATSVEHLLDSSKVKPRACFCTCQHTQKAVFISIRI